MYNLHKFPLLHWNIEGRVTQKMKSALKSVGRKLLALGIDPRAISSFRNYPMYLRHKKEWKRQGGKISKNYMILRDYADSAGNAKGHYFHQDLLVANYIFQANPKRHIDIASRVDGFVAHVASFREIEVVDIRPLRESEHQNIIFCQADLMDPKELGETDSLSCLHAIEHFGLGRYTDPIDVNGHTKGIDNLIGLVAKDGAFYLSFPIGKENQVHFNAHRVFHPKSVFSIPSVKENLQLERFDYVDDAGNLHLDVDVEEAVGQTEFGCGIYSFRKL